MNAKGRGLAGLRILDWTVCSAGLDCLVSFQLLLFCFNCSQYCTRRPPCPALFLSRVFQGGMRTFHLTTPASKNSLDEKPIQVLSVSAVRVSSLVRHSERLKPKQRYTQTPPAPLHSPSAYMLIEFSLELSLLSAGEHPVLIFAAHFHCKLYCSLCVTL